MEHLEKIFIAVLIFVITSVMAYLFKMRQLYAAAPKLYRHSPLSKDGSLCELIIYNRGNQAEEDIQVELDPALKVELLASGSTDIAFSGSAMTIKRLHKGQEASAILLVENGVLESTRISVSSKATKGKVYKSVSEIPPNFAISFMLFVGVLAIFPAMFYGPKAFDAVNSFYVKNVLETVHEQGWRNLNSYHQSSLRKSYADNEFPIRLLSINGKSDGARSATFEVYNKTALKLTVYVSAVGRSKGDLEFFSSAEVDPMSKKIFGAKLLPGDLSELSFSFRSHSGIDDDVRGDWVTDIVYVVKSK